MSKMSCPSSIWGQDSNPWTLENVLAPITTRPGLPPSSFLFLLWTFNGKVRRRLTYWDRMIHFFKKWEETDNEKNFIAVVRYFQLRAECLSFSITNRSFCLTYTGLRIHNVFMWWKMYIFCYFYVGHFPERLKKAFYLISPLKCPVARTCSRALAPPRTNLIDYLQVLMQPSF